MGDPVTAIVWLIVFVVSVTFHEAAHAWVAYRGGDMTAYHGGQVTLNPIPHMQREPIGMVALPLLTVFTQGWPFGWASAPYDPRWEQQHPRRAAWMAAAGPAANFALAGVALVILHTGLSVGIFEAPESVSFGNLVRAEPGFWTNIGRFLSMLLGLNAVLGVLNIIPLYPLDGATAITGFLSDDLALRVRELTRTPPFALATVFVLFYGFGEWIFPPVFRGIVELLYPGAYRF